MPQHTEKCLFCRNIGIYNIHECYGNRRHKPRDDMLEFFGDKIESHLRDDDAICNQCMNIMDNVAKLKRRLLRRFRGEPDSELEDYKPLSWGKKWDVFASMSFDEDSDVCVGSRSPTPNSLLICKSVVPYDKRLELKIAERARDRSLSRTSYARSEPDSEIVAAFNNGKRKYKRKRGHNWSRRKNGRYSRSNANTPKSHRSRRTSRSTAISEISILSSESYESFYLPDSEPPFTPTPGPIEEPICVNGALQNNHAHSESNKQPEIQTFFEANTLHECNEDGCTFICENIDLMAQHKVTKHHHFALFYCNFCDKNYTTSDDLEIHKRTHVDHYKCDICRRDFFTERQLKVHWQEHFRKSVPCSYCGKRFVDKKVCQKHEDNVHKRNIPSRIDYKDKTVQGTYHPNNNFEVRMLVQAQD